MSVDINASKFASISNACRECSSLDCQAIVLWSPGEYELATVQVSPPKEHEVRVKMIAASLCHSDIHAINDATKGAIDLKFPSALGHEGAGVVESVGPGVASLAVGDKVIITFMPACNLCALCCADVDTTNVCLAAVKVNATTMSDGSLRVRCKGRDIHCLAGGGCFAEYVVMHESKLVKVRSECPLEKLVLLSCGFPTGFGSAVKVGRVKKGDSVVVFGLGTIGLSAVAGARFAGATTILGVDVNPGKFALAKEFGVTICLNPNDLREEQAIEDAIIQLSPSGVGFDVALEAVGSESLLNCAIQAVKPGGRVVLIGIIDHAIKIEPRELLLGKQITGTFFGGYRSKPGITELADLYMSGQIRVLDKLVSKERPIAEFSQAVSDLLEGKTLRTVFRF